MRVRASDPAFGIGTAAVFDAGMSVPDMDLPDMNLPDMNLVEFARPARGLCPEVLGDAEQLDMKDGEQVATGADGGADRG